MIKGSALERLAAKLAGWQIAVRPELLEKAVTHASYAYEHNTASNERLEFLGDAVLELLVSERLYHAFPEAPEGILTRLRASMVCEPTLARWASELGLAEALRLGKGEEAQGGRERPALLADAVEALLGAVYLSEGLESARILVAKLVDPFLSGERVLPSDFKTELQELLQQSGEVNIEYRVLKSEGPDHARTFTVGLFVNGEEKARGKGGSKKEAEQEAACRFLRQLAEKNAD